MVKLFDSKEKIFNSNGDKIIKPLKAKIHKEDNGDFYLDLETDLRHTNDLKEGYIVSANTPQGYQAFRVGNVQKTRRKITTRCYHVFYDSENYLIEDSYVVEKNCNDALDHLNNATSDISPFTTLSDINNVNSFRCVRKSLYEAIETVIERWGGHLVRDNFNIKIMDDIGKDNGVVIKYAKNLKEISCDEIWDDVVTKLLPVGKDGILLNEFDETEDLYVYSDIKYDIPYTKKVSFTQDTILEENYQSEDGTLDEVSYKKALLIDLRQQAQNYVTENSIPKINYTLKANIDKITDIGDTIEVIDERLGINLSTNVISYEYDCILEMYTEIEFGNFKKKLSNLNNDISETATEKAEEATQILKVTLDEELKKATSKIWGTLGESYVIYDGDKILIVDSLPKETARNVILINNGGIGFSNTGINGQFTSAWTIDGTLNMQAINVINLTADLIKGGTLKLGSKLNQSGILEIYDESNSLIAIMDKNGLKMFGQDGSYIVINNDIGFAGFDKNDNRIYWASKDEFHMKKSVVEEEITLCNKLRFIPITLYDGDKILNDGIGLVSVSVN